MSEYTKEQFLVELRFADAIYSIRATGHALDRMEERGIDKMVITGNIFALGEIELAALHATQEEAILIDHIRNIAIVVSFLKSTLKVITVVDKANVWNNRGTKIINLGGRRSR